MDGAEVIVDPHDEVRKLQDLVKKLEKQNEVLRSKTPAPTEGGNVANGEHKSSDVHVNGQVVENGLADKLSLADLDDVEYWNLSSDEMTWLSPAVSREQVLNHNETQESLMSWVRQDFDHPTPEREAVKRDLVNFIDAHAKQHSYNSSMLNSQVLSHKPSSALMRSTDESSISRISGMSSTPSRLAALQKSGSGFDSNTFKKSKRPAGATPLKAPYQGEGDQVHNVPNAADIENLAKQQEESLRQSVTPAKNTLRKHHHHVDGDNGARTSPSRFDVEGSYMSQHRGSFSSDQSGTPPESPHNTNQQFHLTTDNGNGRPRRVVPPGHGNGGGLQHRSLNSSDSSLERHSVDTNGSDEGILSSDSNNMMRPPPGSSRLQAPRSSSATSGLPKRGYTSGLAVSSSSGGGLAKPAQQQQQQRGVSPRRQSGLPTVRRQIARPSTAPRSSLPQFRRPTNPPSRTAPGQSQDSWQDGCF